MGLSSQMVRERVRRGRRRLRSSGTNNNNNGKLSPASSNDDDNDPDRDDQEDDDELYDDSVSSSSNNRPLYARKGKHLCNMGRERFVAEAPPFLGDILWEHLEMMQKGECDWSLYSRWPHAAAFTVTFMADSGGI